MRSSSFRFPRYVLGLFAVILALSLVHSVGGGGFLRPAVAEAQTGQGAVVLGKDSPLIRAVIAIQNRHTGNLMRIPGIVGTGTGVGLDGQPVIKVFAARAGIPGIPHKLEGVPVEVEVTGIIVAYADPTARFDRPVPIGVSTGHPDITAGTIGCRVIDGNGVVYALSNNHVYADCNDAHIGDSALQPGPIDGGQDPEDSIGELVDFEPIDFSGGDNIIDAAIALSSTDDLGNGTPSGGYGTPSSATVAASLLLNVQKYGRTTGLTYGWVDGINVTVDVCYECAGRFCFRCKKLARFVDQIAIIPGSFSDGGDSGSLIVTNDSNKKPVGLLFAGSSTLTLANPIGPVLEQFGVTVDDGSSSSNSPPTAEFTYTTQDLTAYFTDQSTDPDGSIDAREWEFGDGSTSTEPNPTHAYAASGTYTVTLTVTDNADATDSTSKDVTVSEGSAEITLTATEYKVKGIQKVDLEWSGATTSSPVDIYRNGDIIATTDNDGSYTDILGRPSKGTYTYKVCEQGTDDTCSNEATVTVLREGSCD